MWHRLYCSLRALLYRHGMAARAPRPDPTLQLLGATIRQYRKERRLSQRVLAARMGLRDRYLSQIELGRHNIAVLTLLRLASALELPAASLLVRLEPHPSLAPPSPVDLLRPSGKQGVTQQNAPSLQPADPSRLLRLLGTTIRHYRQQQGLSQRALAASTGLSATYITEVEQGH